MEIPDTNKDLTINNETRNNKKKEIPALLLLIKKHFNPFYLLAILIGVDQSLNCSLQIGILNTSLFIFFTLLLEKDKESIFSHRSYCIVALLLIFFFAHFSSYLTSFLKTNHSSDLQDSAIGTLYFCYFMMLVSDVLRFIIRKLQKFFFIWRGRGSKQ